MTVPEQLGRKVISPEDIDYVVVTHLDCDHANGLRGLAAAKHIMVAAQEMQYATAFPNNLVRFRKKWWEGLDIDLYTWNDTNGPAHHSYDLFGDGSVQFINIPGHTDGQIAVKVTNSDGKFVLLFGDGGYSSKSWEEMITSGISTDKSAQKHSLQWIRDQSRNPDCIKSMACHDPDNKPQVITF
ncbi:MBL fold metallo-hydrolase [Scardovia wiggsiae]